jgi:VanZ family protein
MSSIRRFPYWLPVLLWMSFIFWMSTETFSSQNTSSIIEPVLRLFAPSLSTESIHMIHGAIRKSAHVTEHFILGILLFRAFRGGSKGLHARQWAFSSLLVVLLYAASDEFHQSFISARTATLSDVCIDTLGGTLAQVVAVLWHYRHQR